MKSYDKLKAEIEAIQQLVVEFQCAYNCISKHVLAQVGFKPTSMCIASIYLII